MTKDNKTFEINYNDLSGIGGSFLIVPCKDGTVFSREDFSEDQIKENFDSLIKTIKKEKPNKIKGDFILSAFLTSTMGISYKLKLEK